MSCNTILWKRNYIINPQAGGNDLINGLLARVLNCRAFSRAWEAEELRLNACIS